MEGIFQRGGRKAEAWSGARGRPGTRGSRIGGAGKFRREKIPHFYVGSPTYRGAE